MQINNEQQWNELFFQAEDWYQQGEIGSAIRAYRSLLVYRIDSGVAWQQDFSNYDAIVVERLADLSTLIGHLQTADQLFSGLQQLAHDHQNKFLVFYLSIKRSVIALDQGEVDVAAALLEAQLGPLTEIQIDQLEWWEQQSPLNNYQGREKFLLTSRLHWALGRMLAIMGQYESARTLLERAYQVAARDDFAEGQAFLTPLRLEMAQVLAEAGQFREMRGLLEAIRPTDQQSLTSGFVIQWQQLWSNLHYQQGDFGEAKRTLSQLIDRCREEELWAVAIKGHGRLARLAIFLNQLDLAVQELESARALINDLDEEPAYGMEIELLEQLVQYRLRSGVDQEQLGRGIIALRQGQAAVVAAPAEQLAIFPEELEQTGSYLSYFEARAMLWQMLISDGQWARATEELERIQQVFRFTDSSFIQSRMVTLSLLDELLDDRATAATLEKARQVLGYYQQQKIGPERWQLQRFLTWHPAVSDQEKQTLATANQDLLNQMTASLEQTEQALYLLNKWEPNEEYLLSLIQEVEAETERIQSSTFFLTRWRRIWRRRGLLQQLQRAIDRNKSLLVAEKATGTDNKPTELDRLSWWQSWWTMPKDRAELAFLVLPDRLFVVIRGRYIYRHAALAVSRIQLRQWVKHWHASMHEPGGRVRWVKKHQPLGKETPNPRPDLLRLIANSLQLEKLVNDLPARIHRLTIVSDDLLHALPWGALPLKGQFLLEHYALSFRFSSATRDQKLSPIRSVSLLGASQTKGYFPLPGVKKELSTIADFWQPIASVEQSLDQDFDQHQLQKALQHEGIVHLACHGEFDSADPGNSGLVLPDGSCFTLRDILDRQQQIQTDHLTLSACWSADHYLLPGRWIISIPEVFYRVGTASILASLWEVDDETSVSLMLAFYERARVLPRDVALQQAIKELLLEVGEEPSSETVPLWAGFQLFGRQLGVMK